MAYFFLSVLQNAFTNTNVDTRNVLVSEVIVAVQDVQDTPPEFTILPTYVEIPKSIQEVKTIQVLLLLLRLNDVNNGVKVAYPRADTAERMACVNK